MRIRRIVRHKLVVGLVVAGAVGLSAAGASVFTNSTTFTNTNLTVGYGSEDVSGAVVTSIQYGLSTDGSTIQSVTFTAQGDTSASAADIGFSTISSGDTAQATTPCATGTYDATTTVTTYVCNNDTSGIGQAVANVYSTNIVVH